MEELDLSPFHLAAKSAWRSSKLFILDPLSNECLIGIMIKYTALSFFWLVSCTAQILISRYARHEVDSSVMFMELLPTSKSISECFAYCKVNTGCVAAEFDRHSGTCMSVRRGSISWSAPSRKVHVDMEKPSKIPYGNA